MDMYENIIATEAINYNNFVANKKAYLKIRRFVEFFVAIFLILILSPIMLTVALIIRLTSKGAAIYTQDRMGLKGVVFKIYKFRSMKTVENEEHLKKYKYEYENGFIDKTKDDPRVTQIGKFIRKFSIDELPQLFNVIKGDMSLVGPRPVIMSLYTNPYQIKIRTVVRPGMTGLWQVKDRANSHITQQIEYDIEYIENISLRLDLYILFRTISVVFSGKGAY